MSPSADAGKLILNMLGLSVTLVLLIILASELIRSRRLAKAKEDLVKLRWKNDTQF
jgi:hypothetical protein